MSVVNNTFELTEIGEINYVYPIYYGILKIFKANALDRSSESTDHFLQIQSDKTLLKVA